MENQPTDPSKWFTPADIVKGIVFFSGMIISTVSLFYNLKSEIHDNKIFNEADKRIVNYRLNSLEAHFSQSAILPKSPEITNRIK